MLHLPIGVLGDPSHHRHTYIWAPSWDVCPAYYPEVQTDKGHPEGWPVRSQQKARRYTVNDRNGLEQSCYIGLVILNVLCISQQIIVFLADDFVKILY